MAAYNNDCKLVGGLGRDPELRFTKSGEPWMNVSMAVNKGKKDDNIPPLWVKVKMFGPNAELVAEKFKKGDRVEVHGAIDLEEWTGRDGQPMTTLTVRAESVEEFVWKDNPGGQRQQPKRQPKPRIDPDEEPF